MTESILLQRLKDSEAKDILSSIDQDPNQILDTFTPAATQKADLVQKPLPKLEEIKPYEEFW